MHEPYRLALTGLGAAACCFLAATGLFAPVPRLVWNASRSAPIGLYRVYPGASIEVGDMVIARLPNEVRLLAAQRHYLPLGVPLVKRVAAAGGARVCARAATVTIDGRPIVRRKAKDRAGRLLPAWHGCRTLGRGDVLLLMTDVTDSFDGRYFGPTAGRDVIGEAVPLWVR